MVEILAIIPARGGSKGIIKKNIQILNNLPLIAHSIKSAQNSKYVTRIIVSTDDLEIATIAKKYGSEVPFIRPSDLAMDDTLDLPVIEHALSWLKEKEKYVPEIIIQLRPTSPLRPRFLIDEGIEKLNKYQSADSLRAVTSPKENPYKMWTKNEEGFLSQLVKSNLKEAYNMPRQKLPETLWQTGHIDIIKIDTILKKKSLTGDNILPLYVENKICVDIDNEEDLVFADRIIKENFFEFNYNYKNIIAAVKLIIFDFDGVFTDNKVYTNQNGIESVSCDRSDGLGINLIKELDIHILILSTEKNEVVLRRAEKLNLKVFHSIDNKFFFIKNTIMPLYKLDLKNIAYVGNDINDLESMENVGLSLCPLDSYAKIKEVSDIIISKKGGDGVIREVYDIFNNYKG